MTAWEKRDVLSTVLGREEAAVLVAALGSGLGVETGPQRGDGQW